MTVIPIITVQVLKKWISSELTDVPENVFFSSSNCVMIDCRELNNYYLYTHTIREPKSIILKKVCMHSNWQMVKEFFRNMHLLYPQENYFNIVINTVIILRNKKDRKNHTMSFSTHSSSVAVHWKMSFMRFHASNQPANVFCICKIWKNCLKRYGSLCSLRCFNDILINFAVRLPLLRQHSASIPKILVRTQMFLGLHGRFPLWHFTVSIQKTQCFQAL